MTRPARRATGAILPVALLLAACGASATPAPASAPVAGAAPQTRTGW